MIPLTPSTRQPAPWQSALAAAVTDPAELLGLLELDAALLPAAKRASELFPLRVPRAYIDKMTKGDSNDPLLRQVLPVLPFLRRLSMMSLFTNSARQC